MAFSRSVLTLCFLLGLVGGSSAVGYYNIGDYGAVGNGKFDNTKIIQQVIELAAKHADGGYVQIPDGDYLTGTVYLRSKVFLQFKSVKSTLLASSDPSLYNCLPSDLKANECEFALVVIFQADGSGITGNGFINGQANSPAGHLSSGWDQSKDQFIPKIWTFTHCGSKPSCQGLPSLVRVMNSTNTKLTYFNAVNGPSTHIKVSMSTSIDFQVSINASMNWPGNTGAHFIGCNEVIAKYSHIKTGGPGIQVETFGIGLSLPSDNFNFTFSDVTSSSSAILFGPMVMTSINHVNIYNVVMKGTNRGVAVTPRLGSGDIHDFKVDNCIFETKQFNAAWIGNAEPVHFSLAQYSATQFPLGQIHQVVLTNLTSQGENGIVMWADLAHSVSAMADLQVQFIGINIQQKSNYTHPGLDLRPSTTPHVAGKTSGVIFQKTASPSTLHDVSVHFLEPKESYYGECFVYKESFPIKSLDSCTHYSSLNTTDPHSL